MVTIVAAHLREGGEGNFMSLELQGDVELVQSMNTGRFYATSKKCFIPSTFTEQQAKALIGRQLPGSIIRVDADPYEYTVPETGEVIVLSHTYTYLPPHSQSTTIAEKEPELT
ncbi:hypothetical protein [Niabella aquatica]